jgi:hypothetical protein
VNCSVRGANCRYTIHSPATEPLIATPLESFQTFPSPALSGMRALLHQMLIATQHSDQGPRKHVTPAFWATTRLHVIST